MRAALLVLVVTTRTEPIIQGSCASVGTRFVLTRHGPNTQNGRTPPASTQEQHHGVELTSMAASLSVSFSPASFVQFFAIRRKNLRSSSSFVRAAYHSHSRARSKHSVMVGDMVYLQPCPVLDPCLNMITRWELIDVAPRAKRNICKASTLRDMQRIILDRRSLGDAVLSSAINYNTIAPVFLTDDETASPINDFSIY